MSLRFTNKLFVITLMLMYGLLACKSSDNTIVITEAPTTSGRTDSTIQPMNNTFQQLTIGENQPIRTLDPLFAETTSELRALQLIYEGLVRYNENGEIIPAIAKSWTVNDKRKTYRFTLRDSLFYHDSNAFSNGLGRKLVPADVKFVFERMARNNVPGRAAQLFMNIEGFEPYYQEQRQVLQPEDRQLKTISGIQTPNDSTVVFELVEPDETFLNKLATPYAVVYPQDALASSGFKAVGTGPFRLSQHRTDSLHIFAKFNNYRRPGQPKLDRVDVKTSSNERALLRGLQVNNAEIQLIPELAPSDMAAVLNDDGRLKNSMQKYYQLFEKGTTHYFLRYHEGADIPKNVVVNALSKVQGSNLFPSLPNNTYEIMWSLPETSGSTMPDSLSATFSDDPFVSTLYAQLRPPLQENGINFSVSSSRVPNRNTPLRTDTYFPIQETQIMSTSALATLSVKSIAIARSNLDDLNFNSIPWWIDLRQTTVPLNETR